MSGRTSSYFYRICNDRRGAAAVMVGGLILVLAAFSAVVIDLGYLFYAQRQLQASADAAALAGAQDLNVGNGGTAVAMAVSYSGVSGGYNANPNLIVAMAPGYPQMKCLNNVPVSCGGSDSANAIMVVEQATVPLYFARVLGINSWQISATAIASAKGSVPIPLDVMIVLDTTGSMSQSDTSCGSGMTKIKCALLGIQTLLGGNNNLYGLLPCSATCGAVTNGNVADPMDRVGLIVYPGLTSTSQVQYETDCSASAPTFAAYKNSPTYSIVALSSDYRGSATATTLTTSSILSKAAGAGGTGCSQGVATVPSSDPVLGSKAHTFFADAISQAQNSLVTNGRTNVQKVIIVLSDGDANADSSLMTSAKRNNQCQQGINAAHAATAAGTWVYSIAYDAPTSATGSCSTDSPHISACSTMQQIASDPTKFYSDSLGTGTCVSAAHPSYTDLQTIFKDIVQSTTKPRLWPSSTT